MSKRLVLIFFLFLLSGCYFVSEEPVWDERGIPNVGNTPFQVLFFVARHVTLIVENDGDYWQSPAETYELATGDCEDYSILAMYIIKRDTTSDVLMATSNAHAWLLIDGEHWEPQIAMIIDDPFPVVRYYTLDQVRDHR